MNVDNMVILRSRYKAVCMESWIKFITIWQSCKKIVGLKSMRWSSAVTSKPPVMRLIWITCTVRLSTNHLGHFRSITLAKRKCRISLSLSEGTMKLSIICGICTSVVGLLLGSTTLAKQVRSTSAKVNIRFEYPDCQEYTMTMILSIVYARSVFRWWEKAKWVVTMWNK